MENTPSEHDDKDRRIEELEAEVARLTSALSIANASIKTLQSAYVAEREEKEQIQQQKGHRPVTQAIRMVVNRTIYHAGKEYNAGDIIELTPWEATRYYDAVEPVNT